MNYSQACQDAIIDPGDGEFHLEVEVDAEDGTLVLFWAANPPNYNTSFSGSGIPFPTPNIAFEETPNQGAVKVENGSFHVFLHFPNSFYTELGQQHIPPRLYFSFCGPEEGEILSVDISNEVPYRRQKLRRPPMPNLLHETPILDTQERILIKHRYPSHNLKNDSQR